MRLVFAAMVGVGTAFAVVLGVAFQIRPQVHISDDAFGTIAGLAIVMISVAIPCAILRISPFKAAASALDTILAIRFRPSRPPAVRTPRPPPLPSAEQIAYAADLNATATCVHLQPIERAMRLAGLDVKLRQPNPFLPVISAACRINEPELRRRFALPPSVYYKEGYQPDRSEFDNPRADIFCGECLVADRSRADILTLHPDECRPDTPWFPAPPASPPPLPRAVG